MKPGRRETLERPAAASGAVRRHGLLIVDKTAGPTSHDVVMQVRRTFADSGAGHLGTLDPVATGLLIVALGAATRCISVLQGGDKTYDAVIRLGVSTSTQDLEGEVLETRTPDVSEAEVRDASLGFLGATLQVPPMVSALKHRGERLHAIARRGETVEREPRTVHVRSWEWLEFTLPEARFRVRCSGGTYVRTLAHDLGQRLGCGAALVSLRRLRSEPFGLDRSVPGPALEGGEAGALWESGGVPLEDALRHLPSLSLTPEEANGVGYGRAPQVEAARMPGRLGEGRVVLRDPEGYALALAEIAATDTGAGTITVLPKVVFPWAVKQGGS